jgi:hypothetical protein
MNKPKTDDRFPHHNRLLQEVYRDLAVCLGGIIAVHGDLIDDKVIWEISRALGGLFRQHCRDLAETTGPIDPEQYRPHPAIVSLLRELQIGD